MKYMLFKYNYRYVSHEWIRTNTYYLFIAKSKHFGCCFCARFLNIFLLYEL